MPAGPAVGKRTLVDQLFGAPVQRSTGPTGQPPIQAKLTPRGEELALAWHGQVLGESTLEGSTARRQLSELIAMLRLDDRDPAEADRQLLALLGGYPLPQVDPHAIFDDVVPGRIAVERISAAHRQLVTALDRHVHRDVDDHVEHQIVRADKTRKGGGAQSEAIAAVRSGTFTSVKDNHGDLSPSVNGEGHAQVIERAQDFTEFVASAEPPAQAARSQGLMLYRRVKSQHLQSLTAGATVDEILPFSASWSRAFAEDWSPGEGVIFEIAVPLGYPMLFQARRPGAEPRTEVVPLNQDQDEVTLVQSRLTLVSQPTRMTDARGRSNVVARVTATPLSLDQARRQQAAVAVMSDEHRQAVAAQQREDDPVDPDPGQQQIAVALTQLDGRVTALIAAVPRARPEQIVAVGQRISQFTNTHNPAIGPALSVLRAFALLGPGDHPLLQTLLRRLFNPQYFAGAEWPANKVSGLLGVLLGVIEKAVAPEVKQLKRAGGAPGGGEVAAPGGGGQPLPDELRTAMEGAFGADFADVRVHQGGHVSELGAQAYTQGTALHFAPGQYAPDSPAGRELIGHELAHVVQQRSGRVATGDGAINTDPQLEAEADAAGARAARGEGSGLAGGAGGARISGPVQRKVVASSQADQHAVSLIENHSARRDVLAKIRNEPNFDLIFMAGEEAPEALAGVSGVTFATLFAGGERLVRINNSQVASSLSVATLKRVTRMEVEVFGFTTEKLFTSQDIVHASPTSQALAIIHEVERHALPFFDLFERIQMGRFESEVMNDDGNLQATRNALQSGAIGNAEAQHQDPTLAANTAQTALSLADQVGGAAAHELVFRLYVDTIARGVAMTDLTVAYQKAGGQRTPAWLMFEGLVTKLTGAVLGEQVTGPLIGRRIMVIDGVFRGIEGTVSPDEIPPDLKHDRDEVAVRLDNGEATGVRPRDCWFLR
jgi:hypothetical protein